MFKKIWTDPVWSKVISALILSGLGYIAIIMYSWYQSISIIAAWDYVKPYIVPVLLIFAIIYIPIQIYLYYKNKKQAEINRLETHKKIKRIFKQSDYWSRNKDRGYWDRF